MGSAASGGRQPIQLRDTLYSVWPMCIAQTYNGKSPMVDVVRHSEDMVPAKGYCHIQFIFLWEEKMSEDTRPAGLLRGKPRQQNAKHSLCHPLARFLVGRLLLCFDKRIPSCLALFFASIPLPYFMLVLVCFRYVS